MTDIATLQHMHCRPRAGAENRIDAKRVDALLSALPEWALIDNREAIEKTFRFSDYYRSIAFVNALAFVAHREDHHPDLSVHYNRVVVRFSTHDVGGLSENDFICAARVEALAADSR